MHKRILAIVTLLCAIPLLAFAGTGLQQINTWVQSGGGTLQVDSYPAQTVFTGAQFYSYSSSTSSNTVKITPAAGYFVNQLIYNGVPTPYTAAFNVTAGDTVWVNFLRTQLSFTVTAPQGVIASPSGVQPNVYVGATYRIFEFIPAKGQNIASIVASNITYTTNPATLPAAVNQKVIVMVSKVSASPATLTATTGVTVTPSNITPLTNGFSNAASNRACDACHIAQQLDPGATVIFTPWSTSVHNVYRSGVPYGESASACITCHNISCATCHQGANTGAHPGQAQCISCHKNTVWTAATVTQANWNTSCSICHAPGGAGTGSIHAAVDTTSGGNANQSCVGCHSVGIPQHASHESVYFVNDNNGVRVITGANGEFGDSTRNNAMGYRSHHIYNGTNVAPEDAQCIACHLEGKPGPNHTVIIDTTKHMADAKIHLRDGNTKLGQAKSVAGDFAWDPANPDHTLMDQFCMSCHNASGAVTAYTNISSALNHLPIVVANATSAGPKNPFGDLLSNAYDQKARPAVVNVFSQFSSGNPSHHAVRAQKYSGRTRFAAPGATTRGVAKQTPFTQYSGAGNADIHKATGASTLSAWQVFGTYSTNTGPASGFGPKFPGIRTTLYDAGLLVATYTTLNGQTLGDDSSLHCGDCHSVGQWTNGSAKAITWNNHSTASGGSTIINTTAVIGAHGSQNEYMLRTSDGSDSLQKQSSTGQAPRQYTNGTYVCFLCHTQKVYGDNAYTSTTTLLGTGAAAESASEDEHGGNLYVGGCNGAAYSGYGKIGTARYGVLTSGTATPGMGNLFAMSCAHCHNSGQQNFGGIHGATGSYMSYSTNGFDVAGTDFTAPGFTQSPTDVDGSAYKLNVTHKPSYRFMGGESNRYNGGATASKWEAQTANGKHREGCYNLSQTADKTHLWNTTTPQNAVTGGTNAIQNNNGQDSAWGATDYTSDPTGRFGQNNTTSGWGSCNHHQGSTTTGTTAPARNIQRPLVY